MYFYRAAVYITYESRTVIDEYTGRVAAWHHSYKGVIADTGWNQPIVDHISEKTLYARICGRGPYKQAGRTVK